MEEMPALRLLPDFEDAVRHINGVRAASVVTGPDAVPTEIHVLAATGKAPKQVVRDVQSLALAQFDIDVDHRIVSVVQIGDDQTIDGEASTDADVEAAAPRPAITSIMVRTSGAESEATVTLAAGGHIFEAKVIGPGASTHRPRLVAQATLQALSELLGTQAEVESALVEQVGPRELAVVVLTVMVPRHGEQAVVGAAIVRGDASDAIARAVLAALNRRLAG
jgi:hypothetical protein